MAWSVVGAWGWCASSDSADVAVDDVDRRGGVVADGSVESVRAALAEVAVGVGGCFCGWWSVVVVDLAVELCVGLAAACSDGAERGVVVWTVLVGGLIACGLAGRPVGEGSAFVDVGDDGDSRGRRGGVRGWAGTGWMVVVVCVVLAGPMVQEGLVWIGSGVPGWVGLCSPMTFVGAVTGRGFEAPPDVLAVWTWSTLGWIGAVGVCLWIAAFVRDGGRAAEARRLRLRGRSRVAAGADREDDASSGPDGFGVAGDEVEEKE